MAKKNKLSEYIKKSTSLKAEKMPEEVRTYFFFRWIGLILGAAAGIVIGIKLRNLSVTIMILLVFIAACLRVLTTYFQMSNGSIYVYEGTFLEIKSAYASGPVTGHTFGKTTIEIVTDGGLHITAGAKSAFEAAKGDRVRIYARKSDIFEKNKNTIDISMPVIIKNIQSSDQESQKA